MQNVRLFDSHYPELGLLTHGFFYRIRTIIITFKRYVQIIENFLLPKLEEMDIKVMWFKKIWRHGTQGMNVNARIL